MKKFLSDVLVDCNLTVSGTTSLGAATGITASAEDNSTALATTEWVTTHVSTNAIYSLRVPTGTTNIRLSSGGVTEDVTISATGAAAVSRVSDSEIRITSSNDVDYVSLVSLVGNNLEFTGVGNGFAGTIDLSEITSSFNATDVVTVYERVKNVAGGPLQKGTPLAVVPGQTSGNLSDVVPADASDPSRMPAVFILNEDLADQAEGDAVVYGNITGIDTSAFDSGTTVYVAPGGGWTADKPIGTDLIQNLGVITKSHPTNGGGVVMGAGRSNDVPNIPNGYAWVGNANGVATPTLLGSLAYSSATYDNYGSWNLKTNGVQRTTVQSGGNLDIVAGSNVSVAYGAGGVVTISSTNTNTDTNNYITGLSFSTSTGVLTATREGLGDLTVDLDGRYASSGHNHDSRYIRKDVVDSFTGLTNDVYDDTPGFLKGVISLRPGSEGGNTGIGFSTTVNVNTETGQDYGYLWWYDDNNNYAFGNGSGENAALILGIQNDSSTTSYGGTQDALVLESSANIFFNPGLSGIGTGGVGGPDFSQGNVYIGRADEAYVVYHQGNLVNVSQLTNDAGYLTEFSETDPVFTAHVSSGITATKISNWDTAHGWGDHSDEGYMLQPQWVQPITSGFGFHDDLGSGGDLNWAIGATDRGGVGQPGQNAFIIEKRTDGVEFTGLAQGTEVFTLDDSGNLGLSNSTPDHRLDVNGNIMTSGYLMVGNDTAVRIAKGSGTGNPVPQEVASFGSSVHIGAFIDFTIYNETKEHMRSGTMQLAFNADQVVFNEVSTMDIGDTTPCILNAVNNDGVVSVTFETPDPSFYIKYQVRTI
jgi:hypothetical protein